jgi:sulfur carrier protein
MKVTVNGEPHELPEGSTLEALLQELGLPHDAQATAVNGDFVPRTSRPARGLREGDAVTCFQPIVGG